MWKPSQSLKSSTMPAPGNPYLAVFNYYSERGERKQGDYMGAQSTYASSRWCPTPEQLRALEEFYRRGIRTPSTYQIQQITAQLRRFGKIEGKNVFYWFQNHKARERQKIRRRLSMGSVLLAAHNNHDQSKQQHCVRSFEGKTSEGMVRRTDLQVQQTKSWVSILKYSAALQEPVSIPRADTTGGEKDGWIEHLMDRGVKQRGLEENNGRMCLDMGISPSRHSHVSVATQPSNSVDQCISLVGSAKISASNLKVRPKTLDLFPVCGGNSCHEKANEDPVQFYEFL